MGLSAFFDLPTNPNINPGQFVFGVIVTIIVIGFVIASRLIWTILPDDTPGLLLKVAIIICILIDVGASWIGTKRVISFDDDDPVKAFGLALVIALVVLSKIGLSSVLFGNGSSGK
jgi:tryptophan-rich sensory protein